MVKRMHESLFRHTKNHRSNILICVSITKSLFSGEDRRYRSGSADLVLITISWSISIETFVVMTVTNDFHSLIETFVEIAWRVGEKIIGFVSPNVQNNSGFLSSGYLMIITINCCMIDIFQWRHQILRILATPPPSWRCAQETLFYYEDVKHPNVVTVPVGSLVNINRTARWNNKIVNYYFVPYICRVSCKSVSKYKCELELWPPMRTLRYSFHCKQFSILGVRKIVRNH